MINLELSGDFVHQNSSESEKKIENFEPIVPVRKTDKKFRLQCRNFFLTYPKTPVHLMKEDFIEYLTNLCPDYSYMCVAKEKHQDDTPHFHVLLMLQSKKHIRSARYFDMEHGWDTSPIHCNIQAARNVDDVLAYINKTDKEPATCGVFVSTKTKKKLGQEAELASRAAANLQLLSQPIKDSIDTGLCSIFNYTKLKENILAYNVDTCKVPEYFPKTNYWIVGATGIGKSRWVRDRYPGGVADFFYKAQNKWWDGYNGQKVVLIDDFDLAGRCLGHHLKIWGDVYRFSAEIKGGTMIPNVESIIITSQYTPRDIWLSGNVEDRDHELVKAVMRRFPLVTVKDGVLIPYEDEE